MTSKTSIPALAVVAVMTAVAVLTVMVVGAASAVAATPTRAAATHIPTLTNDVGRPNSDAGWQLLLGLGLLIGGLLIALVTFAAHRLASRQRLHASRTA